MSARTFRLVAAVAFLLFLLPFLRLVVHTSQETVILSRYSTGFFYLLVAYAGTLTAALAGLTNTLYTGQSPAFQLTRLAAWIRCRRWAWIPLLVLQPLVLGLAIYRVQAYAWGRSAVVLLPFLALVLLLDSVLLLAGRNEHERNETLARMTLLVLSTLLTLGSTELVGYLWERNTAQGALGWTMVAVRRLHLERHGSPDRPYRLFRPNEDC